MTTNSVTNAAARHAILDKSKPFGWADRLGYALGDIGNNFSFSLIGSFLMIFYTNVFGLRGATVGLLSFGARFLDAIVDVTVGRMIDNSKLTSRGRFIPWMMRMKYPLAVTTILVFFPPVANADPTLRVIYAFVTYLLWGISYSCVNIPYGSMASAVSNDPMNKTSLSTWRAIGAGVGAAVVSYVLPLIIYADDSRRIDPARFFVGVVLFTVLAFLAYMGTTYSVTERIRVEKQAPVPLGRMFADMFRNRSLLSLVLIDVVIVINVTISGSMTAYVFNDYFRDPEAMSIAFILGSLTVFIIAPFAQTLVRRFGRRETASVALIFAAAMYGLLWILQTHSVPLYLTIQFFGALGAGTFNLMVWAFITDVTDDHEVKFGAREDGIVYGVNSFARKVAQAIGTGLSGLLLGIIGYQSSTTGGTEQTASTVTGLYQIAVAVPTVSCLIAGLLLMFVYPLKKQDVLNNAAVLRERYAMIDNDQH